MACKGASGEPKRLPQLTPLTMGLKARLCVLRSRTGALLQPRVGTKTVSFELGRYLENLELISTSIRVDIGKKPRVPSLFMTSRNARQQT